MISKHHSPRPNPVTAKCLRTGEVLHFPSMVAADIEGGFSQSCISRVLRGLSKSYAGYEWSTSAPLRPSQRSQYREQIKALHAQGKNPTEIAAALGCARSTVHYNIKAQ